jgi:hypothetical protein
MGNEHSGGEEENSRRVNTCDKSVRGEEAIFSAALYSPYRAIKDPITRSWSIPQARVRRDRREMTCLSLDFDGRIDGRIEVRGSSVGLRSYDANGVSSRLLACTGKQALPLQRNYSAIYAQISITLLAMSFRDDGSGGMMARKLLPGESHCSSEGKNRSRHLAVTRQRDRRGCELDEGH